MQNIFQILKTDFGFDSFRPLQEEIINHLIHGNHCLVLMPTGGGKSLCFQVPALAMEGTALVISPLISLMRDQVEGLRANGIAAAFLNSSLSRDEESRVESDCLTGRLKLLYVSPEKVVTLRQGLLSQMKVSLIAIDEAHCISQWGHDFRPEYTKLAAIREQFPQVPVIALTATADKTTRRDILRQLEMDEARVFISSFDRPNIRLEVRGGLKPKIRLMELVQFIKNRPNTSGIIYCLSRKGTEKLSAQLLDEGIRCEYYHAGMSSDERTRVQEAFTRDEVKIICATIAFGMGIDKSNVRWVVHYNLPSKIEGYYQEIGRAGRDGLPADALLFYNLSDLMLLTQFAAESGKPELNREKLKRMQEFAEARFCRRTILLNYFAESTTGNCNNCDNCTSPPPVLDGTIAAQKALSAILRTGEKEGIKMVTQILKGSSSTTAIEKGYNKLPTFGAGKDLSYETWQSYILQFILTGIIEIAYDEGFALKATELGRKVVAGQQRVEITDNEHTPVQSVGRTAKRIPRQNPLFDLLIDLRQGIAQSERVAPHIIFSDKTLHDMAMKLPATEEEMLTIEGVSQGKMIKYGEQFIHCIKAQSTKTPKQPKVTIADIFFGSRTFDDLQPKVAEGLRCAINDLPTLRPSAIIDNDYILDARKMHPRSYEPWHEPEVSLFRSVVVHTNRLELIADIFQRSPDSIKAYYKRTFAESSETPEKKFPAGDPYFTLST